VTDNQVHNYMKNKLKSGSLYNRVRWIGGKHDPGNKTFAWTDCSSSDYNPGWHDSFPNNADGDRDCVFYTHEYKWGHKTCKFPLHFVCSVALCADDVPSIQDFDCNSDECAPNCAPGWEEFDGKCYFWSQEKLFWGAAELKCRAMGGHLASVTSSDTHDFLHTHEKTPAGLWIGGTDQVEEGNWTWTDCSPWNFTRWGLRERWGGDHQQPDNQRFMDYSSLSRDGVPVDGDGENCALFTGNKASNKDWADVACNLKKKQFVCSKPICSQGTPSVGSILGPVPLSALFSYFYALLFL